MLLATHTLVGAALGKNISNPWIVVILSLALHFILDTFRHGEYLDRKSSVKDTWWKNTLDLLAGFLIVSVYIFFSNPPAVIIKNITIGIFFSILPDFLTLLYWKFHLSFLKKVFEFHTWCHKYPPFEKERVWNFRNSVNDISFSIFAIIILFL
jgi:hypothetical protein